MFTTQTTPLTAAKGTFEKLIATEHISNQLLHVTGIAGNSLSGLLLDRQSSDTVEDQIWRHIIAQSRGNNDTNEAVSKDQWTINTIGMAYPGLQRIVNRSKAFAGNNDSNDDLESAAIEGFIYGLTTIDMSRDHLCRVLCDAAYTATRRLAKENQYHEYAKSTASTTCQEHQSIPDSTSSASPGGHVDLVLAEAIRQKIITRSQAKLIGTTRIDGTILKSIAQTAAIPIHILSAERQLGETRLSQWLEP